LDGDLEWMKLFDKADVLIGHNAVSFDFMCLEKLFNYKPQCEVIDTLLLSQILNYNAKGGHSLGAWGEKLNYPKGDFNDFSKYTPEMDIYCERDVSLTVKVFKLLENNLNKLAIKNPKILTYVRAEHAVAKWSAQANLYGWPFDIDKANILLDNIAREVDSTHRKIQPIMGIKAVAKDKSCGEVPVKKPKWIRNGDYDKHTADWFFVHPSSGQDFDRLVEGDYCRVEFKPLQLTSVTDVKTFLYRNNWKPTSWNMKLQEDGTKKRASPKITEDSLSVMGDNGQLYLKYLMNKSRYSLVSGWKENYRNGVVHGDCFTIGTPSMRSRHSIIVNVPSVKAAWGNEMRELFKCSEGTKLVGCDSAGNQARGLAFYLKSEEYTHLLLNEDIHSFNASVLTTIIRETLKLPIECTRESAKRVLYAFLFGAAGGKLAGYISSSLTDNQGKIIKREFIKAVPGFKFLLDRLNEMYENTKERGGEGYIRSIAGNRIYVDSPHKLLVYLLQSLEKITCSAACMLLMQYLESEDIPYQPLIMMHDELDFMVPEEYAERAAELGIKAFREGPKLFGVDIMDGSAKIGNNWKEIH
jgi:DNA polymerase-1